MTNTRRSRFVVLTKDDQPFAGHKLGSLAAAIHALLRFGNTPMSEGDIIRSTRSIAHDLGTVDHYGTVMGHLNFWHNLERDRNRKQHVYLHTDVGWAINPNAVYNPQWQGGTDDDARRWYETELRARR